MKKPNGGVDILGGYFTVYPSGDVWSNKTHQFVGYKKSGSRYFKVDFGKRNLYKHRLIAHAFLGLQLDSELTVDHIDGNPSNNSVQNLRIISRMENSSIANAYELGVSSEEISNMVIEAGQWGSVAKELGMCSGHSLKSHCKNVLGLDVDSLTARIKNTKPDEVRRKYSQQQLMRIIETEGSQNKAAKKLGISQSTLAKILREKS